LVITDGIVNGKVTHHSCMGSGIRKFRELQLCVTVLWVLIPVTGF